VIEPLVCNVSEPAEPDWLTRKNSDFNACSSRSRLMDVARSRPKEITLCNVHAATAGGSYL